MTYICQECRQEVHQYYLSEDRKKWVCSKCRYKAIPNRPVKKESKDNKTK